MILILICGRRPYIRKAGYPAGPDIRSIPKMFVQWAAAALFIAFYIAIFVYLKFIV